MKPAHVHLISSLTAELWDKVLVQEVERPLRLLDIGCGYGQLILDFLDTWGRLGLRLPEVEVYGFEVYDHRAGIPGYREAMQGRLSSLRPDLDWKDRIRFSVASDPWPFPDHFFDAAISNQVLEHVEDLSFFFSEQSRVVKSGGVAVHFYPSRETFVEPHCGVPFAHRVRRDGLRRWIRGWSRLGAGKFRSYRQERGSKLNEFCSEFYDYLGRYVYFRSNREILDLASVDYSSAGFGYSVELLERGLGDDWAPGPYALAHPLKRGTFLAPLGCSTLVQRFQPCSGKSV